jgi:hypothetical protein
MLRIAYNLTQIRVILAKSCSTEAPMVAVVVSILVYGVMLAVLCGPPFVALHMLRRRVGWARPEHRRFYHWALGFAGAALLFNLFVSIFFAPEAISGPLSDMLSSVHVLALALSWVCFWSCIALAVFVRRRRRYAA